MVVSSLTEVLFLRLQHGLLNRDHPGANAAAAPHQASFAEPFLLGLLAGSSDINARIPIRTGRRGRQEGGGGRTSLLSKSAEFWGLGEAGAGTTGVPLAT